MRGAIRRGERLKAQLWEEIRCSFEGVEQAHFSLEGIFGESMDFSAKEEFTEQFCARLL